MNRIFHLLCATALSAPLLLGCQAAEPGISEKIQNQIRQAGDKVRQEIAEKGITLQADGLPEARIDAAGQLHIDGKPVALDAQQQALLEAYRDQLQTLASAGVDIGLQGAELGVGAAASALGGLLRGEDAASVEAGIQAQAEGVRQAARQLCDHLPGLIEKQDAMVAVIPQLAGYVRVDAADVTRCREDGQISLP